LFLQLINVLLHGKPLVGDKRAINHFTDTHPAITGLLLFFIPIPGGIVDIGCPILLIRNVYQ
jgi:hypothetical protein